MGRPARGLRGGRRIRMHAKVASPDGALSARLSMSAPPLVCLDCSRHVHATLCFDGRTPTYGQTISECSAFRTAEKEFAELSETLAYDAPTNTTSSECLDALAVYYCAQQEVFQDDGLTPSACSTYRRPQHADVHTCLSFCTRVREACPGGREGAAHRHCEESCRAVHVGDYCKVIQLTGLDPSAWPEDTLDITNVYRLEAEADIPQLRNGRPTYRSIPARRSREAAAKSGRKNKLDYYIYSTRQAGYDEVRARALAPLAPCAPRQPTKPLPALSAKIRCEPVAHPHRSGCSTRTAPRRTARRRTCLPPSSGPS